MQRTSEVQTEAVQEPLQSKTKFQGKGVQETSTKRLFKSFETWGGTSGNIALWSSEEQKVRS